MNSSENREDANTNPVSTGILSQNDALTENAADKQSNQNSSISSSSLVEVCEPMDTGVVQTIDVASSSKSVASSLSDSISTDEVS